MSDTLVATLQQSTAMMPAKFFINVLAELAWLRAALEQNNHQICRNLAIDAGKPYEEVKGLFERTLEHGQKEHFHRLLKQVGLEPLAPVGCADEASAK